MHCLEVIVARNERAAAREEAHAVNDGNTEQALKIGRAMAVVVAAMALGSVSQAVYAQTAFENANGVEKPEHCGGRYDEVLGSNFGRCVVDARYDDSFQGAGDGAAGDAGGTGDSGGNGDGCSR